MEFHSPPTTLWKQRFITLDNGLNQEENEKKRKHEETDNENKNNAEIVEHTYDVIVQEDERRRETKENKIKTEKSCELKETAQTRNLLLEKLSLVRNQAFTVNDLKPL